MKKIIKILLLIVMAFSVVGCSGGSDDNGNNSDTAKNDPIKIEDLKLTVEEGINDYNQRIVMFNYTNNSKYTIVDFQVKFTLKNDVTEDQLKTFNKVKEEASWSDEELKEVYIDCTTHKMVEPGESLNSNPVRFNETYRDVDNIELYNLMEPDVASIAYLSGSKVYLTRYDYKNKKYTEDSQSGIDAYQWIENDLTKYMPKPDVKICMESYNLEDSFSYECFGVDKDYFKKYVEAVKEKGFIKDSDSANSNNSGNYQAKNEEGYEAGVYYYGPDEKLSITLKKPS